MIIGSYAGTGKSMLEKKYPNKVIDLESSDYKWIYTKEQLNLSDEERKNTGTIINKDYPFNYIKDIIKYEKIYDIVLISNQSFTKEYMKILVEKYGKELVLVYPEKCLKKVYMNRYKDRKNNVLFLDRMDKTFDEGIDILENISFISKKIKLTKESDTLESKLIELGLL